MKVIETGIENLLHIIPQVYQDQRGQFWEFYKSSVFEKLTNGTLFNQDNISFSKKNVLRGLHFQTQPSTQAKIVTVISGKVLDVVVDIRSGSPTFGKTYQVILSSEQKNQLIVPAGFAHGFSAMEDSYFLYKCSSEYNTVTESGVIWNDQDLKIDWMNESPIISDKDKKLPTLRELIANSVISR